MPSTPRVLIVSPARADANNGNWHTAERWRRFLAPVVRADIAQSWDEADVDVDMLVALHALRSAASIARWRAHRPEAPLALVLTGTDLYRDLERDSAARHSLQCASRVVVLQPRGLDRLDDEARLKAVTIVQSAPLLLRRRSASEGDFVAVGHLRDEKDPLTLMAAARRLAARAPVAPTLVHIGAALDPALGREAETTMASGAPYRWLGPLPQAEARRVVAAARALVHASRIEGGANVVVEAIRSRVPVLASRIDGNVGLLGAGYDGYFAVGDAAALAELIERFASDAAFAAHLAAQCRAREALFAPAEERRAVRALLAPLTRLRRGASPAPTIAQRRTPSLRDRRPP